jgi:DNA-binding transcriptional LysR family regulator
MSQLWTAAHLDTFARIVKLNGFSAAARAAGVPKAAVSRALAALEGELGLQLLERTTRRIHLTEVGRLILDHAERVAASTEAACRAAAELTTRHSGPLRVIADPELGRVLLTPLVPRFLERFPQYPLELNLSASAADPNIEIDPSERTWDVAVRPQAPSDGQLTSRALGAPPAVLCATPQYLAAHGVPQVPQDLAKHALLVPASPTSDFRLLCVKGTRREEVRCAPQLAVNDPAVVHAATAAGLGIGLIPEFLCRQGIATGKLKLVLPGWSSPRAAELHAAYPKQLAGDPRVHAFVDFLSANVVPALAVA